MVRIELVAIPALVGFSVVLQGCGGGGGGEPNSLHSCSGPQPQGDDLKALEKMQWGYRVDAKAALLYSQSKPLFKYCLGDVRKTKTPVNKLTTSVSSSASKTSEEVGASVSLSGSYGPFSAAASASYQQTSQSNFKSIRVDRKITTSSYHVAVTTFDFHSRLTADTKNFLETQPPAKIADSLGEFFATEASFGGLLMSSSVIELTESDNSDTVKAEADASFGVGGVKVGFSKSSASYTSNAKQFQTVTILGGDNTIWAAVSNRSGVSAAQAAWGKTISGEDMFLVETKLKPIWELLEGKNDAKAKEIEDFLKKKWKDETGSVKPYGEDGNWVPVDPNICPKKFAERQHKAYPGVKKGKFFCTTTAPYCSSEPVDCHGHEAVFDHWSSDCDGIESGCWSGNKVVCFQRTECCDGYKESGANECVKIHYEKPNNASSSDDASTSVLV